MLNKKKQRNKKEPSPELADLLRIVNLAPMKVEFPTENLLTKRFEIETGIIITDKDRKTFSNNYEKYFWDFLQDAVLEICKPYPELENFVLEDRLAFGDEDILDITSDYFYFLRCRRDIRNLVLEASRPSHLGRTVFSDNTLPSNYFLHAYIENGKFNFELTKFAQALQNVDINKLSICPICEAVFWVFRLDKRCCSVKCGNILKMREYRLEKRKERERLENHFRSRYNNSE